jgi:hypothetical protein
MALNGSGPISLAGGTAGQSIALELGLGTTTTISLNQTAVRTLAGVASGAITMPTDFYGKSNRAILSFTFTSNTTNAALNVNTISGYLSGTSDITVTVNSGVYLYATTAGNYGLNLTGATTGDTVTLVNNGYIIGFGGPGGSTGVGVKNGANAGPAFNVGTGINITVNNTNASAFIAGGGGGGASGNNNNGAGGGGAGGAKGGDRTSFSTGGAGGGPGSSGSNGNNTSTICGYYGGTIFHQSGGGGGRILPGTGGAGGDNSSVANRVGKGGGSGGGGVWQNGANGGAGGSANAAGGAGSGTNGLRSGGGGGGWGASGGSSDNSAGAGGKAVNLNGKSVTFVSGNTTRVYGAVS